MNKILSLLFAVSLTGCMATGTDFDTSKANNLEKGVTTESQVYSIFGNPMSATTDSNGRRILVYSHTDIDVDGATYIPIIGLMAGGATSKSKTLVVTIQSGLVTDWTVSNTEARTN